MLEIFNILEPFFEDCYRRINVREFSRISNLSPPTSSKKLEELHKLNLLKKQAERNYIYYYANKDSELFIDLSRIYWKLKFEKSDLLKYLEHNLLTPVIILFGSLSKAEAKHDSDIDLAIFTPSNKKPDLSKFEKKLKRKIDIFIFKDLDHINTKELRNNILNGYKLKGLW